VPHVDDEDELTEQGPLHLRRDHAGDELAERGPNVQCVRENG